MAHALLLRQFQPDLTGHGERGEHSGYIAIVFIVLTRLSGFSVIPIGKHAVRYLQNVIE